MKKFFALFLTAALVLTGMTAMYTAPIFAETADEIAEEYAFSGTVIEVDDAHFTFINADEQTIQANLNEDTVIDGTLTEGALILVTYDGKMTRSIPAQITALTVSVLEDEMDELTGTVTEITEEAILFTTADGQIIQANLNEDTVHEYLLPDETLALGDYIHVAYDGKMTRSIPAQITAQVVRAFVQEGQVTEVGEDHFMLTTALDQIQVNCTAEQLLQIAIGQQVKVYFSGAMTMSLPAQIGAEMIVIVE